MIKVSIDKLYPGFATDELIMVYVFGFERLPLPAVPRFQKPTENGVITADFVNHYSTDIKAAWDVVKEMSAKGYWCYMGVLSSTCYAIFTKENKIPLEKSTASTYELPLAICRAALFALQEAL